MLTATEGNYAGGVLEEANASYYLYTGQYYWFMTPYTFQDNYAFIYRHISNGGVMNGNVVGSYGIRPAISLKAGTTAISGDGTTTNPYVIE